MSGPASVELIESDLAPGDREASAAFDWSGFEVARVTGPDDPRFELAYRRLWEEFGPRGEMEQREVLARRLRWDPRALQSGHSLGYEMVVVLRGGALAAVRDHTAIVVPGARPEAIVHLSHLLIEPGFRGTGLVGWLRSLPVRQARECLKSAGSDANGPISLVAEMEPWDPAASDRVARLRSYGRAGFRMADPKAMRYLQPDFRPFEQIDASGGPSPLPLNLVMRRVGREQEREIDGAELRRMVSALYTMYGTCFREKDMRVVWDHLRTAFPAEPARIRLVSPSANGEEGESR